MLCITTVFEKQDLKVKNQYSNMVSRRYIKFFKHQNLQQVFSVKRKTTIKLYIGDLNTGHPNLEDLKNEIYLSTFEW